MNTNSNKVLSFLHISKRPVSEISRSLYVRTVLRCSKTCDLPLKTTAVPHTLLHPTICVCVRVFACVYVCMCACVCEDTYAHIMNVHNCTTTCVCIHVQLYIDTYHIDHYAVTKVFSPPILHPPHFLFLLRPSSL